MSEGARLHPVIELVFVLLFTVAGIGAALLALKQSGGTPLLRWLFGIFCALALANLAFHVWKVVAEDPVASGRVVGSLAVILGLVWAYRRFLAAVRRRADQRRP